VLENGTFHGLAPKTEEDELISTVLPGFTLNIASIFSNVKEGE
jgi:hypothetical protein